MIKRIYDNLKVFLKPQKALIIYGPRRVGKTTLLKQFLAHTSFKYKLDSGDNIRIQQILSSQDFGEILQYAEGYNLIVVDEAQQIPNIGMGLKIILDQKPGVKIIATGSSSFDLSRHIGEPLTGRKKTIVLYPISQGELLQNYSHFELKEKLEEFLIFGAYPESIISKTKKGKTEVLRELADSYLLKDILSLEKIKAPRELLNLLKLLAFQIGGEVSLNELATQLSLSVKTVDRYLDLLEKSFVIVRLGSLSRNPRKEVIGKQKYYFVDNGIRNAVISQFNDLKDRNDIGQLWENFIFMERFKKRSYKNFYGNVFFWRTYDRQEIDFVEERNGHLHAYECKWSTRKRCVAPKAWKNLYPSSSFSVITPQNYLEFIS